MCVYRYNWYLTTNGYIYTYICIYIYIYLAMCETICNIHIYNFFFLLKGGKPIYAQLCLGSRRLIADIKYQAISTKHYTISKLGNGTGTANPNRQRTELCRPATQIQILRAGIACDLEPVTNRNLSSSLPLFLYSSLPFFLSSSLSLFLSSFLPLFLSSSLPLFLSSSLPLFLGVGPSNSQSGLLTRRRRHIPKQGGQPA